MISSIIQMKSDKPGFHGAARRQGGFAAILPFEFVHRAASFRAWIFPVFGIFFRGSFHTKKKFRAAILLIQNDFSKKMRILAHFL